MRVIKTNVGNVRWRSSIWKLLWKDLLAYTIIFLLVQFIYKFALPEEHQIQFEHFVRYCNTQNAGKYSFLNKA